MTYAEAERTQMKMLAAARPRTGKLYRRVDATGISGTGTVGWITEFPDGSCVLRWCTEKTPTTVPYLNVAHLEEIHGHGGFSVVVWDD